MRQALAGLIGEVLSLCADAAGSGEAAEPIVSKRFPMGTKLLAHRRQHSNRDYELIGA